MTPGGGAYFDWDEAAVERLTKLWRDGWSASAIGRDLGISRNAALGKVRRLRIAHRPGASAPTTRGRAFKPIGARNAPGASPNALGAAERRAKALHRVSRSTLPPAIEDATHAKPLLDRGPNECAWIIGEPGAAIMCCAPVVEEGSSWCAFHHAAVFAPPDPRRTPRELIRSVRRYA